MTNAVTYNEDKSRYEQEIDGEIVFAVVKERDDGVLNINHVEAPPALRGTGAAGRFMKDFMKAMRDADKKVHPICGYAAHWLDKHTEYQDRL